MSYKISLILSMIFVAMFFLLGIDFIGLQFAYTELDQKAITISYLIAQNGNLLPSFINRIEITYDVEFICNTNCTPAFGDVVEFTLIDEFNPIVISNDTIDVSIKRTSIIGYYD